MYLSIRQVERALGRLRTLHPFFGMTYLALKKARLPVGRTRDINFAKLNRDLLTDYYHPVPDAKQFYSPFKTSGSGWVSDQHPRTTLQRIAKDTFGDAFLHESGTTEWGWKADYVGTLERRLQDSRIPIFDLAVWLYRDEDIPDSYTPQELCDRLASEFHVGQRERTALFADSQQNATPGWLTETKYKLGDLLSLIGRPPGALPESGAALRQLEIREIGPAKRFVYEPGPRVTIVTGDNSLGKTFLLDAVWYALTNDWSDCSLYPRRDTPSKAGPRIRFSLATGSGKSKRFDATYDWERQRWSSKVKADALPGLVIYGRFDGSFSVWDPAKALAERDAHEPLSKLVFSRQNIWDGLQRESHGQPRMLCNGLIRDVANWQGSPSRYPAEYSALVAALQELSPSGDQQMVLGRPVRLPFDSREIPCLKLPYGDVPILHASAGVQRIVALAYFLVWAWHEHVQYSELIKREPQRRLIVIVDEIEAHLHPRWQRVIVPSLMGAISQLEASVVPQVHLATHSPLVMASMETIFEEALDTLYRLDLRDDAVHLESIPFVKRGRVDYWLMSDAFGLAQPRSVPAEEAIGAAKELQKTNEANQDEIRDVHQRLQRHLAQDDEFWPRWMFWAKQRGVE